jgi:hypothetical protein
MGANRAKPELIYLATPYSHPDETVMESRFIMACRIAASMIDNGHFVFSPIVHSHPIAQTGEMKTSWAAWQRFDIEMLKRCEWLIVVPMEGWKESKGIRAEVEWWLENRSQLTLGMVDIQASPPKIDFDVQFLYDCLNLQRTRLKA